MLAATVGCVACGWSLYTALAHEHRLQKAIQFRNKLAATLEKDTRFTNVTVGASTLDTAIHLGGVLSAEKDIQDIRAITECAQPPRPVIADLFLQSTYNPTNRTWPEVAWKIDPKNELPWIKERSKQPQPQAATSRDTAP